jgi:hypothetical protein
MIETARENKNRFRKNITDWLWEDIMRIAISMAHGKAKHT